MPPVIFGRYLGRLIGRLRAATFLAVFALAAVQGTDGALAQHAETHGARAEAARPTARATAEIFNLRITSQGGVSRIAIDLTRPVDFIFGPAGREDVLTVEFRDTRLSFPAGRRMTAGGLVGEYAYLSDAMNQGRLLLLTRAVARVVNVELFGPRQTQAGYRIVLDVAVAPPSAPWQTRFGYVPWATRLITVNSGLPPGPMQSFVLHRLYRDSPTQVHQQIRPAPATRQAVPQLAPGRVQQRPVHGNPALGSVRPEGQARRALARSEMGSAARPRVARADSRVLAGPAPATTNGASSRPASPAAMINPAADQVADLTYQGPGSVATATTKAANAGQSSSRLREAVAEATGRARDLGLPTDGSGPIPPGPTAGPVSPVATSAPQTGQLPPQLLFPDGEDSFDLDPSDYGGGSDIDDPLEDVNRVIFAANDFIDQAILRPVAWVYGKVTPEPLKDGLGNAFENLKAPVVMANDLFQLEFERAATNLGRFVINSTVGVAGLWDAADAFGLKEVPRADFGQTLHSYGVGSGPYIVMPILGPSNLRDFAGSAVDGFINPFSWVLDPTVRGGVSVGEGISLRESVLGQLDQVRESSVDYYAAIRSFYWQNRRAELESASGTH